MITVKEEFLTDEKTERAIELGGYAAVVMWLALKSYAARKKTNGFIPDSAVNKLAGAPKSPRKALRALVDCGLEDADGNIGSGLVDQVERGWMLHDYLDHAPSSDELQERQNKDRLRKKLQRDRARLRNLMVERGWSPQAAEKAVRDLGRDEVTRQLEALESRDSHGTPDGTDTGQSRWDRHRTEGEKSQRDPRTGARAQASVSAPDPAQPSPASSVTEEVEPKDGSGQGRELPPEIFPPRPPDPLLDSLTGRLPDQRNDVRKLFEAWKRTFRFTGDKLRRPSDFRARVLAEAIDDYGFEACERVLAHAPNDGMVSGRDDEKRVKHETIDYIFGNANTFARILRAAEESERNGGTSAAEMIAALKQRKTSP